MTGYQEVVTDPSFAEQIVCFTAPMVGNYGVAAERSRVDAAARARRSLMREARGPAWTDWLHERGHRRARPGSTRASLVLHLRERGAMRAAAVAGDGVGRARRSPRVRAQPPMAGRALVARRLDARAVRLLATRATCASPSSTTAASARSSAASPAAGAAVTVFPHDVDADELAGYDGVAALERPRRPEPLADEVDDGARAARPRAGPRHLPRPPAARAGDRATRRSSSRSATAARTIRCSSARPGRVLVTSQNHGFAVAPSRRRARRRTSRSTTAPSRASTSPSCARARCSSIPRRARARTTPGRSSRRWVEEVRACRGGLTSSRSA